MRASRPTRGFSKLPGQADEALLAAMPAEHADIDYFLAATGVRITEALHAVWQDIRPDEDGCICLTIRQSKTEAGVRTIPLSPETVRRLNKRRAIARFATDADPIFPSSSGTAIDPHNYRRDVFKPAATRAGIPWATPHKLRHSWQA
jgi:integrase